MEMGTLAAYWRKSIGDYGDYGGDYYRSQRTRYCVFYSALRFYRSTMVFIGWRGLGRWRRLVAESLDSVGEDRTIYGRN